MLLNIVTPDTQLFDFPQQIFDESQLNPDYSIKCKSCKYYITLDELKDHREMHEALIYFGFDQMPPSEDYLITKRKLILNAALNKYLRRPEDFNTRKAIDWTNLVKQVNDRYEKIRAYLTNTFEMDRQLKISSIPFSVQGIKHLNNNIIDAI